MLSSWDTLPQALLDSIKTAVERIKEWKNNGVFFNVYTHLDADGLASGGIIASILKNLDVPFKLRILNQLTEETLSNLDAQDNSIILLLDFGSSQKSLLKKFLKIPCIIIDHHQPQYTDEENLIFEVNPHLFGIDGSKDVSSSGLSYLLAKEFSYENVIFSPIALIGALGDRQDCGEKGSFIGLNKLILGDAIENGLINIKIGLKLFGFESRPIVKSLEYTIDPLIPGLSGDFNACTSFLKSIGIDPIDENGIFRRSYNLSSEELRKLIIEIIKYMLNHGISSNTAEDIIGTIYILNNESEDSCLRDAREFSSILNACGRMGFPSYGVALCMGIRGAVVQKAFEIANNYRKEISRILNWFNINKDRVKLLSNIQVINVEGNIDEKLLSPFISIAVSSRMVSVNTPLVGLVLTNRGKLKVSCRMDRDLTSKGINLGIAAKIAAENVGGIGGGHDIAAGAEIPVGTENLFLKIFDDTIGKQILGEK